MIKRIVHRIREVRFAKREAYKMYKKGTLLNSFYESKTIFIHIPKTAGLSIVDAVYGNVVGSGHRRVAFYRDMLGDDVTSYFKFSFVRNPYDRLYSSYKFLEQGGINAHDKRTFDKFLLKYNSFEDFIINGLNKSIINEVVHFIPQTDFICDQRGNLLVDYIGRFENIEIDFKQLLLKINKEVTLPHLNINVKKDSREFFNNQMRKKVRQVYEKDFTFLGYSG